MSFGLFMKANKLSAFLCVSAREPSKTSNGDKVLELSAAFVNGQQTLGMLFFAVSYEL